MTMGIAQAANRLQTTALARQQHRIVSRRIPRLSSSDPFWKCQQQQQQFHQYPPCILPASTATTVTTTTTTTLEHTAPKQQHNHHPEPQKQPSRSIYGRRHHHPVSSSFLSIPWTVYDPRISISIPPHPSHISPNMTNAAVPKVATTTARRFASSLASTDTFRDSSSNGIISVIRDDDVDNRGGKNQQDDITTNDADVVIWDSVNDLETKVMRQMAQRLLLVLPTTTTTTTATNPSTTVLYNAHTWFDAEDALKWWSSQRTVESVQICFALLDRFVQEATAAAASVQYNLDDDDDDDSPNANSSNSNHQPQPLSPPVSMNIGLASFLDRRLMGAIMGNWTAVWQESIVESSSSSTRRRQSHGADHDDDLLIRLTPRIVLGRLDRYAQQHPHVSGFGVGASSNILSNVLNTAITQSRTILRLGGCGGGAGGISDGVQPRGNDDDDEPYSLPWYAAENQRHRAHEQESTRPILSKPNAQPPPTTIQREQPFSLLMDTKNQSKSKSAISSPDQSRNVVNDESDEHEIMEMVQFCTRVLDRLLAEYNNHSTTEDREATHQRSSSSSSRHHGKNNSVPPSRSSVYFCNSVLHLWSHVCSRSTTMADLERAVHQAEQVFSLSLNAGAPLDNVSYNTMLDVYAQAGKGHQAESLLETMFQNWQFFHQEHLSDEQDEHHYSRDHVVEPDVISFNTTAAAWARSTPSHEAPERLHALWQAMLDPQHYGQLPACRLSTGNVFYNTMLLAWAKSGRPDAGEGAEEILREMILRTSMSAESSPSRLYSDTVYDDNEEDDKTVMARKQYEQQQPDIISYGTVAYAYAQVGRAEDAERIARELYQAFLETPPDNTQRREALRPTTVLLTQVIEAWARSPLKTIQAEDRIIRIRAVIDDMHRLYDEGILSDAPDTWTWNVLLRCIVDMATAAWKSSRSNIAEQYKHIKLMQEALDLLKVMQTQPNRRALPNSWSYSSIILGLLEQRRLHKALELLHQACVVEKLSIDIRTFARVILSSVSKEQGGIQEMKQATSLLHRLFDACEHGALVTESDESNEKMRILPSGPQQPAASLVGAVVAGWSRMCNRSNNMADKVADRGLMACQEATALMERMRAMSQAGHLTEGPDAGIMRLVVACWSRFSRNDHRQRIKKESAMKALQYLQEMRQMAKTDPNNGAMHPDLVTYDAVLGCLATAREPQRAETLLKQMVDDYNEGRGDSHAAKPSTECFNIVLLGWALVSSPSTAAVATGRAEGVLDAMRRLSISSNRDTYHHMIHVWSQVGRPDVAENIFYRMKEEHQNSVTMVKNDKGSTTDRRQQMQSSLQPITQSYKRILQAWTASSPNGTGSFNPQRAERLLLEMCQWFKSGENDKVSPSPECFDMVAKAWHELAKTQTDGGQQSQFRERAAYILSLNRDFHESSPSSTKEA